MEQEVIISSNERTQPFVNEWLEEAIAYAVRMHRGAVRKGTVIPYIVHPLEVMNNLLFMGADMALVAAGVDVLVSGSYVFNAPNPEQVIRDLRQL